jgi:hypothetical protein
MPYKEPNLVSYRHANSAADDRDVRFIDLADTPLPEWAIDVKPYEEDVQDEF